MRLILAFVVVSLLSAAASAQIYRWVDKDGNVVYSDVPPPTDHGTQVELEPVNSFEPPAPVSAEPVEGSAGATVDARYYTLLQIVEPTNDTAVRENAGNVVIAVALAPVLRTDHQLRLMLDGAPTGAEATGDNAFVLHNVDRGTHTLAVEVVDSTGATVTTSAPVKFHMLRVAVGGSSPAPTPKPKPKPKPAG